MTNRVITFNQYGNSEVLQMHNESVETNLTENEVLVEMSAFAINRANALFREGNYLFEASFPSRIGNEGVGVVKAIGSGVTKVQEGQRVNLLPPLNESQQGYFADFNIVDENMLLPSPDSFNDYEASTTWIPFLTLYNKFVESKLVQKDDWVILGAASSSVALAAMHLTKHLGAKSIGLTRSKEKVQTLLSLGYDKVVLTNEGSTHEQIKTIAPNGASFAFDPVGGEGLEAIISSMKPASEVCVYGAFSQNTQLPIFAMMNTGVKLSCYAAYELLMSPERLQQAVAYFLPLFQQRHLVPVYDKQVHSLEEVQKGFDFLESNQQIGKVLLKR